MSGAAPPPPPKPLAKGKAAALQRLLNDVDAVEKIRAESTASIFFDGDSPSVRKRRESSRAEFEFIIEAIAPNEPLWNAATFIENTKKYLSTIIQLCKGRLEGQPRTNLLYQRKEALYWWAIRLVPEFSSLFLIWHTHCNAHIGYLALTLGLSRLHREKRNLTDMELNLFFQGVMQQTTSTAKWKQHYLAWLLIWTCGARPGSFTVCPGYEKGSSLGVDGMTRQDDETLRWSDVNFFRVNNGIIVQITLRFTKGQRNPYTRKLMFDDKKFTFVPSSGNRYCLDVATVMAAIALERGLFDSVHSWDQLTTLPLFVIPKDPIVNQYPVFLASAIGKNKLIADKAMKEAALNPAIKIMANNIGLWARNTTYSFRRTAIVETRRLEGTEFAQQLAGHVPGGLAIYAYDVGGLPDLDITAMRLGELGIAREEIRDIFSQINTARIDMTAVLREELTEYVGETMRAHEDYHMAECFLNESLMTVATHFDIDQPTIQQALSLLSSGSDDTIAELEGTLKYALASRKTTRQRLRRELTEEFKAKKLAEHQQSQLAIVSKSKATHKKGALALSARDAHAEATNAGAAMTEKHGETLAHAIESLNAPAEETSEMDTVDSEMAGTDLRQQPKAWEAFGDMDAVAIEGDQEIVPGKFGTEGRAEFVARFIGLSDLPVKGMTCLLCELDVTVPQSQREVKWHRKADLDRHIRSAYHCLESCRSRCSD